MFKKILVPVDRGAHLITLWKLAESLKVKLL